MSIRRLLGTSAAMGAIAAVLGGLTPGLRQMGAALLSAQATVDGSGPDALVLAGAGLAAWLVWAWGALGLALTALSAVPGALGHLAQVLLRGLLPSSGRRAAALALGLGLGLGTPLPVSASPVVALPVAAVVPDWPGGPPDANASVPDWPDRPPSAAHTVMPGDCLWDIAAARLAASEGPPSNAETATAVQRWWSANRTVIGPDPDLLFPGQVLDPP